MSDHVSAMPGVWFKLQRQWQIIFALMLRDIRTRFLGSSLGFVIAILWPLSHIFLLVVINVFVGRVAPYGESPVLWFATGVLPFMCFNYTARFISLGVFTNKALLVFPTIKIIDLLISRAIIEALNVCCVIICVVISLILIDVNPMPVNVLEAFYAVTASIFLGIGFGVINSMIITAIPSWVTGYSLFSTAMWFASGVMFVPDALPDEARYWLSFNPAMHGVEWMRSAYYEGYGGLILDKSYMLEFALISLLIGLVIERLFRGSLIEG